MAKRQVPHKIHLHESDMPKYWYNIQADMKELPAPALNPQTHKPLTFDDLTPIFPREVIQQEMSTERFIEIPQDVREKYTLIRPTYLYRAHNLEKALGTPARIYYKYEGMNPSGSHKINSAIPQTYYNKVEGIKRVTTETGAGQWGTALSIATQMYGLECTVYMVKVSFQHKPYRKIIMQYFGADVIPSPSDLTKAGREILRKFPDTQGSLGDAISEAVEDAMEHKDANYSLGSVLNHVCLHQSVLGLESKLQLEMVDEYPDIVIGCNGGGTNFSGIAFPFLHDTLTKGSNTRFIAVEASACPKLTKGVYRYDYGDTAGMAPMEPMYTLGHDFRPPSIHAGGLRYHGDGALLSKLYHDGYVEASAISQSEIYKASMTFSRSEMILPAPESCHAIAQAIREAETCKQTGESKCILFSLSGNGYFDLPAYEGYINGNIIDEVEGFDDMIAASQAAIPDLKK